MDFQAVRKKVTGKMVSSGDMVYEIVLVTENPMLMDLGKLPSSSLFQVNIDLVTKEPNRQENVDSHRI